MNRLVIGLGSVSVLAGAAQVDAAPVVFDLRDVSFDYGGGTIEDLDGSSTITLTKGGITAVLNGGATTGSTTVFNQTSSGFGLNSNDGVTGTSDVTNQLDDGEGQESVAISFLSPVFFEAVSVSSFGGDDAGLVTFLKTSGNSTVGISATGSTGTAGVQIDLGELVLVQYTATEGNGFSFDSFTVTAVPEPSSLAPLAIAGLLIARRRRR